MRRADRLFLIIHALRGRRTATLARDLAGTLGVSLRTIYRDVADLQLSGVPIEGEAGVGYVLRKGSDIPPLMFNAEELEALVVGTRFVRAFAGERLAARRAGGADQDRSGAAAGAARERAIARASSRPRAIASKATGMIDRLHEAVIDHRVLAPDYRDEAAAAPSAKSSRSALRSGAARGRSARGAACAWVSAISGPTASRRSHRPAKSSSKRRARTRRLPATCRRRPTVTSLTSPACGRG